MQEMIQPRDLILKRFDAELKVAMALGERLDTRAQAIGTTIALIAAVASVVVASDHTLSDTIRGSTAKPALIVATTLLVVTVALSFLAAWPRSVDLTAPQWYQDHLTAPEGAVLMTQEEAQEAMSPILALLDTTMSGVLSTVLMANRRRGHLLMATLCTLTLAVSAFSFASVVLLLHS